MSTAVPGQDPARDAETRVPILVGTAIAFSVAASLVVLLRLYTRSVIIHAPGLDDYTMVIAAVLAIGVTVSTVLQAEHGLGRHAWLVSSADTTVQLQSLFAGEVLYNLAQIVSKVSFLLQYRRIFGDSLTRVVCFWLILYLLLWGITQEFLVAFACIPVSVFVPSMADKCISSLLVWYLTSIMNIVTDFIIFLVPIPAIRRLRLPLRQKVMVMSIFCLGFFTCVISIVRLFTLRAALNSADPTWDNAPTSWWTTIELNCGIICSSVATLRPLLRALSPRSGSTGNGTHATGSKGGGGGGGGGFKAGYHRHTTPENGTSPESLGGGGGGSRSNVFPMRHLTSNESQNGLKEDTAEAADGSQASYEYAEPTPHA